MAKKYQILFSHDIVITYKSFMFVTLILHLYGTHVVMMENHAPLLSNLSSMVMLCP